MWQQRTVFTHISVKCPPCSSSVPYFLRGTAHSTAPHSLSSLKATRLLDVGLVFVAIGQRGLRGSHKFRKVGRCKNQNQLIKGLPFMAGEGDVANAVGPTSLAATSGETELAVGIHAQIDKVKAAARDNVEFSDSELDSAIKSLQNITDSLTDPVDWEAVRKLLSTAAHQPHKVWSKTEEAAQVLDSIFGSNDAAFRNILKRVLRDGHWDDAVDGAANRAPSAKPWVVLVTGVNGIRKTTSIYQEWFQEVLSQALAESCSNPPDAAELPTGKNSFFRQLDHIIATAANEEFRKLYTLDDIGTYASFKDCIFARYRTIAEIWGAWIVKKAKKEHINVMVETSGRDIAMFHYINHFFQDEDYNKLVVHFTINDISFAEKSVDARMGREILAGKKANEDGAMALDIINVNAGGPYGSKVLKQVQQDSQEVLTKVFQGDSVAESWYKAMISINASDTKEWTAHATPTESSQTGTPGQVFEFVPP